LIYEILQLEIPEAVFDDPSAQTDAETLPSGRYVLTREIKKAKEGEPFSYFPPEGGKPIALPGMSPRDVSEYLTLYNRFKRFGLPHGKGWAHELPWVVDLLGFLDDVYQDIQAWHLERAAKGAKSASPEDFGIEE
jgi:hypothetical protein